MDEAATICTICKLGDQNVLKYGEWKTSGDVNIHYFCALLSADLPQRGKDDEGIEGFLIKDIKDYSKIRSKKVCTFCRRKYASVKCSQKNCDRWWHVVCSVDNKCLSIFDEEFNSYCNKHAKIKEKYPKHQNSSKCQICAEPLGDYNPITSVPSCCNQGYYHRDCMQRHANSAGYLAKCPSCGRDADGFRKFLRTRGIFCPDKDADWELEKSAFTSLLFVYKHCDAIECLCPVGRDYSSDRRRNEWFLLKCTYCGEKGIHRGCRETETQEENQFVCENCRDRSKQLMSLNERTNAIPEEQPSTSKGLIDDGESNNNAEETMDNDASQVWKLVNTSKCKFRKSSLQLVNLKEKTDFDPLCDEERLQMRDTRLELFFEKANFNAKPQPPPWLV